ncbi:carboxymuconolactone decarboxylase family protein [Acinetobacter sp. HY1485]|uniref:carboxymuconolactone decarboxylase family protein n=1 Tax=Acinetobacter sp. HY1485 TaxID=2970918 RepID=UPI0022B9A5E2|nr:carboxymuconolactone decarboxylase family protein [Acinetobacter sp. HY1485]
MSARRIEPSLVSKTLYNTLVQYDTQISTQTSLDEVLVELIKVKISQLNGCAYCIDYHAKQATKIGISSQQLLLLNAYQETALFTPKEKAALTWAQALTFVATTHADDEYYEPLIQYFTEKEVVDLTYLVGLVNVWNRLAIGMRYNLEKEA